MSVSLDEIPLPYLEKHFCMSIRAPSHVRLDQTVDSVSHDPGGWASAIPAPGRLSTTRGGGRRTLSLERLIFSCAWPFSLATPSSALQTAACSTGPSVSPASKAAAQKPSESPQSCEPLPQGDLTPCLPVFLLVCV